jgi:hypothetical protein
VLSIGLNLHPCYRQCRELPDSRKIAQEAPREALNKERKFEHTGSSDRQPGQFHESLLIYIVPATPGSIKRVYQIKIIHDRNFQNFDLYLMYLAFDFTLKSMGKAHLVYISLKEIIFSNKSAYIFSILNID